MMLIETKAEEIARTTVRRSPLVVVARSSPLPMSGNDPARPSAAASSSSILAGAACAPRLVLRLAKAITYSTAVLD